MRNVNDAHDIRFVCSNPNRTSSLINLQRNRRVSTCVCVRAHHPYNVFYPCIHFLAFAGCHSSARRWNSKWFHFAFLAVFSFPFRSSVPRWEFRSRSSSSTTTLPVTINFLQHRNPSISFVPLARDADDLLSLVGYVCVFVCVCAGHKCQHNHIYVCAQDSYSF